MTSTILKAKFTDGLGHIMPQRNVIVVVNVALVLSVVLDSTCCVPMKFCLVHQLHIVDYRHLGRTMPKQNAVFASHVAVQ